MKTCRRPSLLTRAPVRGVLPALLPLLVLLVAAPLASQSIRGQMVDSRSGEPIGRAFVALLDISGTEVARVLVGEDGMFLLRAPGPGEYRLRSKRIGFRVAESLPLRLAVGQMLDLRLPVEAIPTVLPPVVVEGHPACGSRGTEATVVALWEEAEEALEVVKWTERQVTQRYTVHLYDRELDQEGQPLGPTRTSTQSRMAVAPFTSATSEHLLRIGYISPGSHDTLVFYAPDAGVLLSDMFTNTHCFAARPGGTDHPGLVGLSFEPLPSREVPDIRGVVWLGALDHGLRTLEFEYTRPPPGLPRPAGGGYVEFMSLPDGTWIVHRWWIRMRHVVGGARGPGWYTPKRRQMREAGGYVLAVSSVTGTLLYTAGDPILSGDVVDSTRGGMPLGHAWVQLVGTEHRFQATNLGHFEVVLPLEGTYPVVFAHPRLDSLRIDVEAAPVTLARGGRTSVTLFVPPEERVIARLCGGRLRPGSRVIMGTVRDFAGGMVPGASIHLEWQVQVPGAVQLGVPAVEIRADSLGRYLLCGIPAGVVSIYASAGDRLSPAVVLGLEDGGIWIDRTLYRGWPSRIWTQDLALHP